MGLPLGRCSTCSGLDWWSQPALPVVRLHWWSSGHGGGLCYMASASSSVLFPRNAFEKIQNWDDCVLRILAWPLLVVKIHTTQLNTSSLMTFLSKFLSLKKWFGWRKMQRLRGFGVMELDWILILWFTGSVIYRVPFDPCGFPPLRLWIIIPTWWVILEIIVTLRKHLEHSRYSVNISLWLGMQFW